MTMTEITTRTITAFFDDRQDATEAIQRLQSEGIPRSDVSMVEGGTREARGASSEETGGFWESLKEMFLPDEDRHTYAEGLRRGGYLVSVRTSEAHYERALDILDDEGTIDMDERAASWRQQGWAPQGTGAASGSSTAATPGARQTAAAQASVRQTSAAQTGAAQTGAAGTSRAATSSGAASPSLAPSGSREEIIPVTEEQLRVGKRDVSHGRVRVRSYVVETPVQEQVGLREEHVNVERRPVDRPVSGNDNLFRERTIEAEERAEEPVIAKQARVKEEVVVKKDADERTETVSDKVRRTEVEVEDERGRTTRPGERKRP